MPEFALFEQGVLDEHGDASGTAVIGLRQGLMKLEIGAEALRGAVAAHVVAAVVAALCLALCEVGLNGFLPLGWRVAEPEVSQTADEGGGFVDLARVFQGLDVGGDLLGVDVAALAIFHAVDEEVMDGSAELPLRPDAHDLAARAGIDAGGHAFEPGGGGRVEAVVAGAEELRVGLGLACG